MQSAVTFFDTPVNILNNHTIYQVVVTSINPSNQQGQSQPRRFNVDFSGVEALADLNVVLVSRVNDVEPTTPRLTWSPTQYPVSQFVSYVVHRHAINTPFIKLPETIIAVITNPQTVTFFDYHAPPGITIEYGVHQQVKIAGSTLDSDHAIATVDVIFHTPTLVSTKNPAGLRVPVMWLPGPGLRFKYKKRRNDEYGSADEHVAELEALIIAGDQVCLRTERRRMFMDIADYDLQRGDILGTWDVTLALEETFRREAVA